MKKIIKAYTYKNIHMNVDKIELFLSIFTIARIKINLELFNKIIQEIINTF